jgi:succinate dehydrogenase / fumarate reductase cytochrome b subunit
VQSEVSYTALAGMFQHWLAKLFVIGLSCAFFHHFYAGIRHLAMDVHWMTSLQKARLSSRLVLGLDVLSVMAFAFVIW